MTDVAEFLQARIAEDEAAVAAILRQRPTWTADNTEVRDAPSLTIAFVRGDYAAEHIARWDPARVLAECESKRRIVEWETTSRASELPEWTPDCGGDWCLNVGALSHEPGIGAFANYWPDNTVSASVYVDGEDVATSEIVARSSRAECQVFAEQWIRTHLVDASPVLRLLALPYADHPDYDESWRP